LIFAQAGKRLISVLASAAFASAGTSVAEELPNLPPAWEQAAALPCIANLYDYAMASPGECPLSWNGLTFYGRIDIGVTHNSHGVPFNGAYPNGVETVISKNSNRSLTSIAPNGLGQSFLGLKGDEPILPLGSDWSLIFNFQTGFDPYSLQRANGPKSLVENNATPIEYQSANGDSSRAGQLLNTVAYAGVSNRVLGALTVGRQDSLVLDALGRYDSMFAASAFSLVGASNTVAGAGDTEDARYNSSVQYRVGFGPFHVATLYQFGGYNQSNGSNGAFEAEVGGDFDAFSFDAVGSKVKDAVSLSNFGEYPLPIGVNLTDLKATLSNNSAGAIMAKYAFGPMTIFGGFEYILFENPTDAYPNGFKTLGGYTVLPGDANSTEYTNHKILRASWTGVRLDLRKDLALAGAYYHYWQNDYDTNACTEGGLSSSRCHGMENAVSGMIDYRLTGRIDAYAGLMWSQVTGGLASGYLHHVNLAPTAGVRMQF
jgi:predicted porin